MYQLVTGRNFEFPNCNKYFIFYAYSDKFVAILSVSTETPGGGSLINDINSFCSLFCKKIKIKIHLLHTLKSHSKLYCISHKNA